MKNSQGQRDRARIHSKVGKAIMERKPGNTRARRGVLLLVVLALLAMFALIAFTYLIVTNQARRAAQTFERLDQFGDPPEFELHQAAMQVIRGAPSPDPGSPPSLYKPGSSVLEGHSLLEGVYGSTSFWGRMRHNPTGTPALRVVAGPPFSPTSTSGQLIQFHVLDYQSNSVTDVMRYAGCVLTMLDGPAAGLSTRVVAYEQGTLTSPGQLQIVAFNGVSTSDLVTYIQNHTAQSFRFLINGPAFAGMGRSYRSTTGLLDLTIGLNPTAATVFGEAALLPNTAFQPVTADDAQLRGAVGGANVDYTAVDYNSMLPAMTVGDSNVGTTIFNRTTSPPYRTYGMVLTPSLHRQELVRYWIARVQSLTNPPLATLTTNFINMPTSDWTPTEWRAFKRRIVLRPLLEDHYQDTNSNGQWDAGEPYFTGSNPRFTDTGYTPAGRYASGFNPCWDPYVDGTAGTYGWDVDNDRDGVPDSIWVDVGLPVRTTPDGQRYKPLVAILCKDLDGRLNLNAHGATAQTQAAYEADMDLATLNPNLYFGKDDATNDNRSQTAPLLRGQGWGPADISLRPLLTTAQLTDLFNARYWDSAGTTPGVNNVADALVQNKMFNYWNDGATVLRSQTPGTFLYNYWDFLTAPGTYQLSGFAAPPTFQTMGAVGLDLRGSPIYARMGQNSEQADTPYDLRLQTTIGATSASAADKPFVPAELERVLRPFDADAGAIPPRLTSIVSTLGTTYREEVTTESWDVPVPSVALPPALQTRFASLTVLQRNDLATAGWHPPKHIHDVLAIKIYLDNGSNSVTNTRNILNASLPKLLPYEMLRGLKMNLNRPFGNGLDDNSNRVVDEPGLVVRSGADFFLDGTYRGEILFGGPPATRERLPQVGGTLTTGTNPYYNANNVDFDHINSVDVNGDGTVNDADRAMARQLYARHLYLLALLAIDHTASASPNDRQKERARMVAQWAVNAVDFSDRDSIMTPFEYDIAPFIPKNTGTYGQATWNVDGVIDATPLPADSDDDPTATEYRGLVWGLERPELLITETLAFHDRRTQDLPVDPKTSVPGATGLVNDNTPAGSQDQNDDFDQAFRPEGSLFVEIYNPSSALEPQTGEFYNSVNGGVELTRRAPGGAPVWRLAIFTSPTANPDDLLTQNPERTVNFVNPIGSPVPAAPNEVRHFPGSSLSDSGLLRPGFYAVVGSGRASEAAGGPTTTYVGFRTGGNPASVAGNTRRIVLDRTGAPDRVAVYNNGSTNDLEALTTANQIKTPVVAVIDRVDVGGSPQSRRLSVSEPRDGYPSVDYAGVNITADDQYTAPYPRPLDRFEQNMTSTVTPDSWSTIRKDGTTPNFRFIHLQRLANPMIPWHETRNPYRTVDSSPIDLTTFNGLTTADEPRAFDEPEPTAPAMSDSQFYTRARGQADTVTYNNNLWPQQPFGSQTTLPLLGNRQAHANTTGHNFNTGLSHTLGYLNDSLNAGGFTTPRGPINLDTTYVGDPRGKPFPWLTWNNRPFATPLELLIVPSVDARELLRDLSILTPPVYPYDRTFGLLQTGDPYTVNNGLFAHLVNFFLQVPPANDQGQPAMMHRVLEYVTVPSLFNGTEVQFNPTTFASNGGHIFPPPFNMVSTYREPGRINLNTIFSSNVWKGLLNRQDIAGTNGDGGILDEFYVSRQGYATLGSINTTYPTRFARPFRGSAGQYLVPLGALSAAVGNEINSTVLRPLQTAPTRPLFSFDTNITPQNSSLITEANQPDRNPYFRYQQLMRLGNLTTTRSNVFAVWLTVGYFEALPAPARPLVSSPITNDEIAARRDYDAVYPDGYTWGQELGYDTGQVKRHRAFYIIDRTIPVGFQRGVDLNAEKTILLKRFIE